MFLLVVGRHQLFVVSAAVILDKPGLKSGVTSGLDTGHFFGPEPDPTRKFFSTL